MQEYICKAGKGHPNWFGVGVIRNYGCPECFKEEWQKATGVDISKATATTMHENELRGRLARLERENELMRHLLSDIEKNLRERIDIGTCEGRKDSEGLYVFPLGMGIVLRMYNILGREETDGK